MRTSILLDNQPSATIFCNPDVVSNIRDTDETLSLATTAGVMTTSMKADVPGWGTAWLCPGAMTNIFSLARAIDRHPVTRDATKEDAFIAHLPHKQVKFSRDPNGLYVFKPPTRAKPAKKTADDKPATEIADDKPATEIVEDNNETCNCDGTTRIFVRAPEARELQNSLETTEKTNGPDIATMEGNNTSRKPVSVNEDYVEEPKQLIERQQYNALRGSKTGRKPATVSEDNVEKVENHLQAHEELQLTNESQRYEALRGKTTGRKPAVVIEDYAENAESNLEAHEEPNPSNTTAPCYNGNEQGGHSLLNLQTDRTITKSQVATIPITPAIIKQVNRIAKMEGMPNDIKITNHQGHIIYDSTWIAGVDYDKEEFEDEEVEDELDDKEYDDSSDDVEDYAASSDNDDDDTYDMYSVCNEMDQNETTATAELLAGKQDDAALAELLVLKQDEYESRKDNKDPNEQYLEHDSNEVDKDPNPNSVKQQKPTAKEARELMSQFHQEESHYIKTAIVLATTIRETNVKLGSLTDEEANQYIGEYGMTATNSEMKPLREPDVFAPICVEDTTISEWKPRATESSNILVQEENGITRSACAERDEAASKTAMIESILITATMETKQYRDMMTADIPEVDNVRLSHVRDAVSNKVLVEVDEVVSKVPWMNPFIENQEFTIDNNNIYQEDAKRKENGNEPIKNNNKVQIEYCPTEDMIADYKSKILVEAKFNALRNNIMNYHSSQTASPTSIGQQECVGKHASNTNSNTDT